MSEYITRERVLEILNDIGGCGAEPGSYTAGWDEAINAAYEAIQDETAADVAPVVHGKWLNIDGDYTFAACSICETAYEVATEEEAEKGLWDAFMCSYRYCPNCGAKMDGGDNIMNTNPECFTPEGNNPYPLCTGKDMPECENCQLRAGWNGGDTDV